MVRTLLAALLVGCTVQAQEKREETATVAGTVTIDGKVARPKIIAMDPACAALHPDRVKTDATLVDGANRVRNAFVWIKRGVQGKYPVPTEAILVDQVGCHYTPRVFGIRVGQPLKIRNSDPFGHNVHGIPFTNKEFNFAQPVKGMENEVVFTTTESSGVMAMIKCDIHGHMHTWAGIVEHPFFAVTDEKGVFTIKGLPPGKYTVGAWQEEWTVAAKDGWELEIEVKAGETKAVAVVLDKKKE